MSSEVVVLPEHRAIVEAAADGYCEHLRRELRQTHSPALRTAIEALLELIEIAQAHGPRLRASDVRFSLRDVEQLAVQERERLLNQYALGLGRDNAAILVVGTEHAYELRRTKDLPNFTLESCASQVLWMCGGLPDVVHGLTAREIRPLPNRPFHIYPNDVYREDGAHTWARLARIVGTGTEHRPGANPGLGDLCYQIELSAYPSQQNDAGLAPTGKRLEFLSKVMSTMASTARVLLFHGRATDERLQPARERLIHAFLGATPTHWNDVGEAYRPILYTDLGERRVIVTRALANSGVTSAFLQRLAALVRFETIPLISISTTLSSRPVRSQTFDASRERLLEAAADILRETLQLTMRPNGSRADANNRMGTFASGVHVGVVTTRGVIRLHIHSDQHDRRAIFEAIATELSDGRLRHPAANVLMTARLGPRNPNLFYLEASWSENEDPDGFGERVAAFAAWLQSLRPRFQR